jgi:hypothetical protein
MHFKYLYIQLFIILTFCRCVSDSADYVRNHINLGFFSKETLLCLVDTGYGLGGSLGDCRLALPKGWKYRIVKTQIESHDRRPIVWTNLWQTWVSFSFEVCWGTTRIFYEDPCKALGVHRSSLAVGQPSPWLIWVFRISSFIQKYFY